MLKGDFFTVKEKSSETNFRIALNAEHPIFKGHFPGNPVVPGVCMIQITKELAEMVITKKLRLTSASVVKFLSLLQPHTTPEVEIKLHFSPVDNNIYSVSGQLALEETVYFKFKGIFHEQS